MPARQKPTKQARAEAFRACQQEQTESRRHLCSFFWFWKACGSKQCLRARACAGDADVCFSRFWPLVPQELKIGIHALIKATQARLSKSETKAAIVREITRWRATMAPKPAPQAPPVVSTAPNPPAPSPRVRML